MIRLWKHLRKEKTLETSAEKELRKKYNDFMTILFENEYSLDLIARLEEKLYNRQLISFPYLKAMISKMSKHIALIIENLIQLSGGDHADLRDIYIRLDNEIREVLTGRREKISTPIVIPLESIKKELADKVGNKMANLGDIHHHCHQEMPSGFAATACAYTHFLDYNDLTTKIREIMNRLNSENSQRLLEAEKAIKNLFLQAKIPPEIESSILAESKKYEQRKGRPLYWAVRSSAIGEDLAESSFAGQFATVLNVPADQLLQAYKEVAASKYTAQVIVYRRMRHIRDDDVAMSIGFMEMIDPVCSGVLYSVNPVRPKDDEIVINAVWGIGELLVDGVTSADVYVLGRQSGYPLVHQETADKDIYLCGQAGGGLRQCTVDKDKASRPCLNEQQLKRLADMAMKIENHFHHPQDIEWCFDQNDILHVLQSRPLRICQETTGMEAVLPADITILADQSQPISPGIGSGKVVKAASVDDLPDSLNEGTVLVLKHSSPRFVSVLRKAVAVVVERGNWTDHMASVIREFGLPCLVKVEGIFDTLHNGQEVTIDADLGRIYSGIVPVAHKQIAEPEADIQEEVLITESHRLLKKMSQYIFPLHLTDPRKNDFTPAACKSWHDILRYCHESALNEMFMLKEKGRLHSIKNVFKIETTLPINLFVLDLHGDTISSSLTGSISADTVKSLPFQKLWAGMNDPDVKWDGPEQDMLGRDLLSAMLRTAAFDPHAWDTRSYAVVSREYLNLSLSMGYHFIVLDCHLTDDSFNNYISLSFKGGAADARKREMRVAFIAELLRHMDFNVTTSGDFLKARLKDDTAQEFGKKLYKIGQIFGVTRLLDLAMENENIVKLCVARFEAEDYSLIK